MKKNTKNSASSQNQWDLSVLYTGAEDPRIEQDIQKFEVAVKKFVAAYSGWKLEYSNAEKLKVALEHSERIGSMREGSAVGYYFGLRRELDAHDSEAEKRLNVLSDRLTKVGNTTLFFELTLGALPLAQQKKLLKNPILKKWHYFLKNLFEEASHHLTEKEERIMNLKSATSRGLWVAGTDKMLHRRMIAWKGKQIPLAEAFELVAKLPKKDRRVLWSRAMEECKSLGEVAENELTALCTDKKVNDELRKFPAPYSATILGNENNEAAIVALVDAVKDRFDISHRFYKLKAKMLKEKKLEYADRSASVGPESKVSFADASATLREVFDEVNPLYARILDGMLEARQIDAFPRKGKTGGAFCASVENLPTYVLLNFVPGTRSLMTFAHEMGHAVHAERAKAVQPPIYQGHSVAVAETASTLFENLVFDANLKHLKKKERIIALHDKLQDDIASIMRQTAFFRFEQEMHETVRTQGAMSHDELATLMQSHLQNYLGPAVNVTKEDGYTFVYVSHFRNYFYVYTYVYGNLVSNAIAERLRNDASYKDAIDRFLTTGCSKSPEAIFADIGIGLTDPAFFASGLARIDARITELESLLS